MNLTMRRYAMALVTLLASSWLAQAAFDPQFTVKDVSGDCQVAISGNTFEQATEGQAYPYGATIKTGRKSSLVLILSDGNECRILANTVLTINEAMLDKKVKSVRLDEGKIQVTLKSDYAADGSDFSVETAAAICGVIGSGVDAEAATEGDLHIGVFKCTDGNLRIIGPQFELPNLDVEDCASIACTSDKSFIRIKNVKGTFDIIVKDNEGNSKTFEMKQDAVVKIWQRLSASGDYLLVTILIISPDDTIIEAINYMDQLPSGKLPPKIGRQLEEPTRERGDFNPDDPDFIFTTTTTTTSTTSTTRPKLIPPPRPTPTAVGIR